MSRENHDQNGEPLAVGNIVFGAGGCNQFARVVHLDRGTSIVERLCGENTPEVMGNECAGLFRIDDPSLIALIEHAAAADKLASGLAVLIDASEAEGSRSRLSQVAAQASELSAGLFQEVDALHDEVMSRAKATA